ncbi:MAG: UTP--glucose-1-phosphate uridylyltransferase [Holosporaceae bacterium]|jgi:UTP--glucose-1-phosphate uridylyltransferase|nr:UTP--glucose-1-phosphate uridylyltransferase [Holosporaceae bacterium]
MEKIRKIVFPVGGLGTRFHPLTKVIPKEMLGLLDKPLIHYAFEEALAAGVEEFVFVTRHGKNSIEDYFDYVIDNLPEFYTNKRGICYVRQTKPLGLGHAVLCAKNVVNNEPFAVMSADDFICHHRSCIGDMMASYNGKNMAAVIEVQREDVSKYGIIDVDYEQDNFIIAKSVCEKPSITDAKSNYGIVGRYVLSHEIFDVLSDLEPGINGEIQLTDAMMQMIPTHGLVGFKFEGERFDCGSKEGILSAILHISSHNPELQPIIKKFMSGEK